MATPETNRSKIVARLTRESWVSEGGAKHEKFGHASRPGFKLMVPRHGVVTVGVARNIAKAAGW